MDQDPNLTAQRFAVYKQLGWFDKWMFRRALRWIASDSLSLFILLDFERRMKENKQDSLEVYFILLKALRCYNREDHDDRLPDRLPRTRLPELLRLVLVFLEVRHTLNDRDRNFILEVIRAGDRVEKSAPGTSGIRPLQFQVDAARFVLEFLERRKVRDFHLHLDGSGNRLLAYYEHVATHVGSPELLTLFKGKDGKVDARVELNWSDLPSLEKIAEKVKDVTSFTKTFQEIIPALDLQTTASLMAIAGDFQEFDQYFPRVQALRKLWGPESRSAFLKVQTITELEWMLHLMETLPTMPRLERYTKYAQSRGTGMLFKCVSALLHTQKRDVCDALINRNWSHDFADELFAESLVDQFETRIVYSILRESWNSKFRDANLRWEFDQFTSYIPWNRQDWNFTYDNFMTRQYWNWGEAEKQESLRFSRELEPRLVRLLRKMDLLEFEELLDNLLSHLSIEKFTQTVRVPVEWEKGTVSYEEYSHGGYSTATMEVARPTRYADHDFIFDRPSLQKALELLDSLEYTLDHKKT